MSEYICNAPLRFSGKDYAIGEKIPSGVVVPKRAKALMASGHLTELTESMKEPEKEPSPTMEIKEIHVDNLINIPIKSDNGTISLTMSPQEVVKALSIVQLTVDTMKDAIKEVKDDDVLILLHAIETRKGALSIIEAQHALLTTPAQQTAEQVVPAQTGGDAVGENV